MLSSVLRSPHAIDVNIAIMRAFVRLRQMLLSHEALARKLDALERKYDAQFRAVFDAMRALMSPPAGKRREIGFRPRVHEGSEGRGARGPSTKRYARQGGGYAGSQALSSS
jgi:hypothetical protein